MMSLLSCHYCLKQGHPVKYFLLPAQHC